MAALLSVPAGPAHACSYATRTFQPLAESVPLSGPIIIAKTCFGSGFAAEPGQPGDCPADPIEVRVDGRVVPGSVEVRSTALLLEPTELAIQTGRGYPRPHRNVFSVWMPDEELVDGEQYQVVVFEDDWENDFLDPIVADAEARWERPEISAFQWSLQSVRLVEGEAHCCSYSDCTEACFGENELTAAALTWSGQGRDFDADRQAIFVYRLVSDSSTTDWVSLSDARPRLLRSLFLTSALEYCAELEQMNLINGETRSQQVCLDADPSVGYGEVAPTAFRNEELQSCHQGPPSARIRSCAPDPDAEDCQLPPESITQAWCEAHADGCPITWGEEVESCPVIDQICERYLGYTLSLPSADAGASEVASPGAVDATQIVEAPAEREPSTASTTTSGNDGCGCRVGAGRGRSGAAGLLLLVAAMVRLRRARRSSLTIR